MAHPEILWAQRSSTTVDAKNVVYLTVNLPDIKLDSLKYDLTPSLISFQAKAGSDAKEYAFKLDLYEPVVPEDSTKRLSDRHFVVVLRKKEKKIDYWPRLTKEKVKTTYVKTDFDKWVDEDEQEDKDDAFDEDDFNMGGPGFGGPGGPGGMGGMAGMAGMGGMGGMGGPGGMDFQKMMQAASSSSGAGAQPESDEEESPEDDSDDEGPPPLEDANPGQPAKD